jgi:hypothetical protein
MGPSSEPEGLTVNAALVDKALMETQDSTLIYALGSPGQPDASRRSTGLRIPISTESPYFMTHAETGQCVLEQPLVFVSHDGVDSMKDLLPLLELIVQDKHPLLIFAPAFSREVISTLVVNKLRGILHVCACQLPQDGGERTTIVSLIEALTQATAGMSLRGVPGQNLRLSDLGHCDHAVATGSYLDLIGVPANEAIIERQFQPPRTFLRFLEPEWIDPGTIGIARFSFTMLPQQCQEELIRRTKPATVRPSGIGEDHEQAKKVSRELSDLLNRLSRGGISQHDYDARKRELLNPGEGALSENGPATIRKADQEDLRSILHKAIERSGSCQSVRAFEGVRIRTTTEYLPSLRFRGRLAEPLMESTDSLGKDVWQYLFVVFVLGCVDFDDTILPILSTLAPMGRRVVLLAHDYTAKALKTCVVNKEKGSVICLPFVLEGSDEKITHVLRAMAAPFGQDLVLDAGHDVKEIVSSRPFAVPAEWLFCDGEWVSIVFDPQFREKIGAHIQSQGAPNRLFHIISSSADGNSGQRVVQHEDLPIQYCPDSALIFAGGETEQKIHETRTALSQLIENARKDSAS